MTKQSFNVFRFAFKQRRLGSKQCIGLLIVITKTEHFVCPEAQSYTPVSGRYSTKYILRT